MAGQNLACVDACPNAFSEFRRRTHGAQGVVLVCDRDAEDAEQLVPASRFHRAAVELDRSPCADGYLPQQLGIEAGRRELGEEHGDGLAPLLHRRQHGRQVESRILAEDRLLELA